MAVRTVLRGAVLRPRADAPGFDFLPDAVVEIGADGRVEAVEPAGPARRPARREGVVLLPGFVDAHVHYPQVFVRGRASGPLLDWLERAVFPEEARFRDPAHARAAAAAFCRELARWGTTAAAIFGSSIPAANEALLEEMDRRGLRGLVGPVLMDRAAPEPLLLPAAAALDAAAEIAERWDGRDDGRLRVAVTPRFAISCTPELLAGAGALARERGLPVQTHLSENREEIARTAELFPGADGYLGVYADAGLVGPRTVLAHCVHSDDDQLARIAAAGAAIAHCPDSNFFLGSGAMRLRAAARAGIRVGLGTDVGAGRSFSLRRVAAAAHDAAGVVGAPVPAEELLWRATRGGALALGLGERAGLLEPGAEADLVAVEVGDERDPGRIVDRLCFDRDAGPVLGTWVRGRRVWPPEAAIQLL